MAIDKKNNMESSRSSLYEAYVQFSLAVDREYLKIPSEYKQVSPSRCFLDEGYKPVSELEKLLEKLHLGHNDSDYVFTIEKDGYQSLVFEHAGQYFLSNWFYDMQEKKLEAVSYPALRSLGVEEILSVAIWASTGADGMLSQTDTKNMADVMKKVARTPVDIPEYDELDVRSSVRAMVLDSILDSDTLTAAGREVLEKKAYDQKAVQLAKQGKTLSVPAMEYVLGNYWNKADMINEVVEASRKPGYHGPAVWNYGIDFKVDGWDEFKGLRYARFNDYIECHVLKNDGSTVPLSNLASDEVRHIFAGFKIQQFVRKQLSSDFKPFESYKADAAKIFVAKNDEKIYGSLELGYESVLHADSLVKVKDYLNLGKGSVLNANSLQRVGGNTVSLISEADRDFILLPIHRHSDMPSRLKQELEFFKLENLSGIMRLSPQELDTQYASYPKFLNDLKEYLGNHSLLDKLGTLSRSEQVQPKTGESLTVTPVKQKSKGIR